MQSRLLAAVVALVLLAGGVAVFLVGRAGDAGLSASAPAVAASAPTPAAPLAVPKETGLPGQRESVAATPPPEAPAAPEPEPTETFRATFTARFVDAYGAPLEGVEVTRVRGRERAVSGADGRFQLALELPDGRREREVPLRAELSGYGVRRLDPVARPGRPSDLGDIVLGPAGSVHCTVLDPHGSPVPDARVLGTTVRAHFNLAGTTPPDDPFVEGRTDATGSCRLEGVPAGDLRVWAGAEGTLWAFQEVRVVAGQRIEVELRLALPEDQDVIELLVLDPAGEPVPSASIQYYYSSDGRSGSGGGRTDEAGRYQHQLMVRVPHDFTAADQKGRYRPVLARGVPPGARGHVLQLEEPRVLALHVSDLTGTPIESFDVRTEMISGEQRLQAQRLEAEPEDGGVVQLMLPSAPFELEVEADGYQVERAGPIDPRSPGAQLEVRLTPLPGARGRVVDEAGRPVAGADVRLLAARAEDYSLTINGFPCRSQRGSSAWETSDADGQFALTVREDGRFYVRAESKGFAPSELGPLELDALVGARGLELVLGRGGSLEGDVLMPPGESAAGVIVGISRGDGYGETQRTDAKGRYRFDLLTPGRWLVEGRSEELSRSSTTSSSSNTDEPQEVPWSCEVWPGRTARFDLDLSGKDQTVVEGHLRFSGAPCAGWQASLVSHETGATLDEDALDSQGQFRLAVDDPGEYTLQFHGAWKEPPFLFLRQELAPWVGALPWERDLAVGRIEGRVAAGLLGSETRLALQVTGPGGLDLVGHSRPGDDGSFLFPGAPAGSAVLTLSRPDQEQISREFSVPAGGVARVDFP